MNFSITYSSELNASTTHRAAALRIKLASTTERSPCHIILLVDVSESMIQSNKLENVKRCISLLLKLMNPDDMISIVTFGETSQIVISSVTTDSAHVSSIEDAVQGLQADGCTNLSAGLASVTAILDASRSTLKPTLLLLTHVH